MCRLIAPWVTLASMAAAFKLPSRAAASKARKAFMGGICFCICQFSAQIMPNYSLEMSRFRKETHKKPVPKGWIAMTIERPVDDDASHAAASPKKVLAATCGIHAV